MRIGRSALDEEAIRLIEEHNPDVEFDWTRILKGQDAPVEPRAPVQDRHGRQRRDFAPRPVAARPQSPAVPVEVPPPSAVPVSQPETVVVPADVQPVPDVESVTYAERVADAPVIVDAPPQAGLSQMAEMPEIALLEELLADPAAEGPADREAPEAAVSAAQARLGSEGLSRLRARHSEVLARISETVADPVRRDELKSQADRLNPDTWVTEAEVTAGLEAYESVFESLRTVVGRRRKRRRRSGPPREGASAASEVSPEQPAGGDEADSQDTGEEL